MITVYSKNAEDFTTNGLGVIRPSSCTVTETLNGTWEVNLTCPIDEAGKWRNLAIGNILRVPVPACVTPAVNINVQTQAADTISREVWTVSSPTNLLNLRSGTNQNTRRIGFYHNGDELEVLQKNVNGTHWYEVVGPDGKRGYVSSNYLKYARTEQVPISKPVIVTQVVESRQIREQPFRIYETSSTLTAITARARHIFYDLMDNMVIQYAPQGSITGVQAASGVLGSCMDAHTFNALSDITQTADGLKYDCKNPVEIFLGEDGLCDKYSGEILRDWYDVFFLKRVGRSTGTSIRYGRDLKGITCKIDTSKVVTRIIPKGEDKDGNPIYLPETYIDSANISAYGNAKISVLEDSEAKESETLSRQNVIDKLRADTNSQFQAGVDLPDVSLTVDFLNIGDTEEYKQFSALYSLFLGDGVEVVVEKLGIATALRMTSYEYDCLLKRYTKCTLGSADEALAGQLVSASQLASGSITGTKLALGSVSSGTLAEGCITSAKIKTAAITAAKIANAAIETAHIADAAITSAKIGEGEIKRANISEAAIGSAQIADGSIQTAHINDMAVTSAKIAEGAIDNAKIKNAAIDSAKIEDGAITTAKIAEAAITDAHIADASISSAKIRDLHAQVAVIAEAAISQANISAAQITDLSAQVADIVTATIGTADIDWANIAELTNAIANIVTAKIQTADIGFAQVKDLVTDTAIITEGTGGKLFISRLAVDAMQVVSAVTNELMVKGEDGKYYRLTISGGEVVPVAEELDGGQIAERSIGNTAIVENSITASELNATSIFADEAIIRELSAGVATFGEIFAESGIVPFLETSIIEGDGALKMAVDGAQGMARTSMTLCNGLTAQVEGMATKDELNDTANTLDSKITSTVKQTEDSLNATFTRELKDTASDISDEIHTMIRLSGSGVEVGKSDSLFKTLLDNSKLSFLQGSDEVAYISNQQMYINIARILTELSIGQENGSRFYWKKTGEGIEFKYANE